VYFSSGLRAGDRASSANCDVERRPARSEIWKHASSHVFDQGRRLEDPRNRAVDPRATQVPDRGVFRSSGRSSAARADSGYRKANK
jgi:hypothetical protein